MKTFRFKAAVAALVMTGGMLAADPLGTFVQFNRASVERTPEQWRADFEQMAKAGIRRVIIQWVAEDPVAYFETRLPYAEKHPVLERMFAGMEGLSFEVYLGLDHDANYWTAITGRDKTVRDYFLVRLARNQRIQNALLEAFGTQPAWKGYYIPDEIDDKSWRGDGRGSLMREYLRAMTGAIKKADPSRNVAVSSFFRARTAPDVYVRTLRGLVLDAGLDQVLVQDGCGESDPPFRYLGDYYAALKENWNAQSPRLECVVEAFRREATADGTFKAGTAEAGSLRDQLKLARKHFDSVFVFSFLDYLDPDLGGKGAAAYQELPGP